MPIELVLAATAKKQSPHDGGFFFFFERSGSTSAKGTAPYVTPMFLDNQKYDLSFNLSQKFQ